MAPERRLKRVVLCKANGATATVVVAAAAGAHEDGQLLTPSIGANGEVLAGTNWAASWGGEICRVAAHFEHQTAPSTSRPSQCGGPSLSWSSLRPPEQSNGF